MKIISSDNFNNESVSDRLIAENVSEYFGTLIVEALNKKLSGQHSSYYFRLVPDDHKLYMFEP